MPILKNEIKYIDVPAVAETFADSVGSIFFDGQSSRIELCVTRMVPTPGAEATAQRYPACRLALTPAATIELFNNLQNLINAMHQQGIIMKGEPPAEAK